jgi:hypothetical protein
VAGQTYPDLVMPNLIGTIDTGAPDLTMRLGPNNPQLQAPYSQFFNINRVPSWYNTSNCRVVNYGVNINIEFTGSTGKTNSYSFPTADTNGQFLLNTSFIGHWISERHGIPSPQICQLTASTWATISSSSVKFITGTSPINASVFSLINAVLEAVDLD